MKIDYEAAEHRPTRVLIYKDNWVFTNTSQN